MGLLLAIGASVTAGITTYFALKKKNDVKYPNVLKKEDYNNFSDKLVFYFDKNGNVINVQKSDVRDRFVLVYKNKKHEINPDIETDEFGVLSKIIYQEVGGIDISFFEKIAVAEVVKNRKIDYFRITNGNTWWDKNTYYLIRTGFGYRYSKYMDFRDKINKSVFEKEQFLQSIQASIFTHYSNSNITNNSFYQNKSKTKPSGTSLVELSTYNFKHYFHRIPEKEQVYKEWFEIGIYNELKQGQYIGVIEVFDKIKLQSILSINRSKKIILKKDLRCSKMQRVQIYINELQKLFIRFY